MIRPTVDLGAAIAIGAGTAQAVPNGDLGGFSLFIFGTFVGTTSIEISHDGVNFVVAKDAYGVALAGIAAPAVFHLAGQARQFRRNCTAFTSGSISHVVHAGA